MAFILDLYSYVSIYEILHIKVYHVIISYFYVKFMYIMLQRNSYLYIYGQDSFYINQKYLVYFIIII